MEKSFRSKNLGVFFGQDPRIDFWNVKENVNGYEGILSNYTSRKLTTKAPDVPSE